MKKILLTLTVVLFSSFVLVSCIDSAVLNQDTADTAAETPQISEAAVKEEAAQSTEALDKEQEKEDAVETAPIIQISPQEAYSMIMEEEDVFLLDVRTQAEYEEGYIEGAVLIPVSELEKRLAEVPMDKKILVYCRSGRRSMTAAELLVNNGYTEVYNIQGGIISWHNAGLPVIE